MWASLAPLLISTFTHNDCGLPKDTYQARTAPALVFLASSAQVISIPSVGCQCSRPVAGYVPALWHTTTRPPHRRSMSIQVKSKSKLCRLESVPSRHRARQQEDRGKTQRWKPRSTVHQRPTYWALIVSPQVTDLLTGLGWRRCTSQGLADRVRRPSGIDFCSKSRTEDNDKPN